MKTYSEDEPATPVYRYLRGYALDPGFSTKLDTAKMNEVVYRVPFEKELKPGPVGDYVAVHDFDPASNCWYEPVNLRDERIASQWGLTPSEGNPQFHQQFVYAVVMKTIGHFEQALGRKIVWYPRKEKKKNGAWDVSYVQRLRIYPHGFREANAYYDPAKTSLLFGYFTASHHTQGANFPGGLVFTCLSPDIVAHETTHAILDSIHHRYMEDTNADVAAFHEGFADIVALLQRFTFDQLVEDQLFASCGRVENYTVLGELATQFGEALEGNRGALRSMIGKWVGDEWTPLKPNPSDYEVNVEPHDRGAVLVATIFDVFQRIYRYKTQDLLRIASNGTGVLPQGSISRDLVHRLAGEASVIAEYLLAICIRALDYRPPVDISFGSYLQALITADIDNAPKDETGYRLGLVEAFRARGIFPHATTSLSIYSLRWNRPQFTPKEATAIDWIVGRLKPQISTLIETEDREQLYLRSNAAKAHLQKLLMGKQSLLTSSQWEVFLNKLGLTAKKVRDIFGTASKTMIFYDDDGRVNNVHVPKIEVHTLRPAFRAGREGRQKEQLVVTLTQRVKAAIGQNGAEKSMVFRGGCTLILSLGNLNEVEYVITKNITSHQRFQRQKDYLNGDDDCGAMPSTSIYDDGSRAPRLDFNLLHQH